MFGAWFGGLPAVVPADHRVPSVHQLWRLCGVVLLMGELQKVEYKLHSYLNPALFLFLNHQALVFKKVCA